MIALMAASAIYLSGLQAGIAVPTESFRGCLRDAAAKAQVEKVAGDNIEGYLKKACTTQMSTLTGALVAFRMKNGMAAKAAREDAAMTVDDYVSTPAENYKFLAAQNTKTAPPAASKPAVAANAAAGAAPALTAKPVMTPAAAPSQPPKP